MQITRKVSQNIRRYIRYSYSKNLSEIITAGQWYCPRLGEMHSKNICLKNDMHKGFKN